MIATDALRMKRGVRLVGLVALSLHWQGAIAQAAASGAAGHAGIFTCIDDQGRRLTSDRPIAECMHKEQRLLNKDGSLRGVRPPALTPEERAERDAQERKLAEARAAQADAARRDRNLISRYPDQASHDRARVAALDTMRLALRASALGLDRKPLLDESEFYAGKQLPAALRAQLDANDAAVAAQRSALQTQETELARINKLYDAELGQLKRLWAGSSPGSAGAVAPTPGTSPAAR
jgi:hypothetical protein